MENLKFTQLPKVRFAHTHKASKYRNVILHDPSDIEVAYIASGSLQFRISDVQMSAGKGDVVCLYRDTPVFVSADNEHEHYTVCFSIPFERSESCGHSFPLIMKSCPATKKIFSLICDIIRAKSSENERELLIAGYIFTILDLLESCNCKANTPYSYGNIRYTEKAKQYIYENITRPIKQKEVADHLGITAQYLCTLFKQTEGMTVISYINRIKLEKIQNLMDKEHLKLYEAAELFGYSDANYVSKLYKQIFHVNISQR